MTELAIQQAGNGVARALPGVMPDVTDEALTRLQRWVEAAAHAHKLVAPLIGTPWVPAAYQPRVDPRASEEERRQAYETAVASATAAVLYGSSLGIDPLMALQQIYVVSGRPALYAKMMVALVQSHGHDVWTEEQTDTRAIVCGRRKGSSHTERVVVTMDMARKAGWTRNQAYSSTPQDMLWARAASRVCDRIASDVLKGIPSVEEAQDEEVIRTQATGGTRAVTPRKRAAAPAALEEPPLEPANVTAHDLAMRERSDWDPIDEEPAPSTAETGESAANNVPAGITPAQRAELQALLRATGRGGRSAAAKYISDLIRRDVASAADLTEDEAQRIIDALRVETAPQQDEPEQPELEP